MENIRIGVIGVGEMGLHHARIFSSLPHVELVGIADTSTTKLKKCVRQFRVPGYTDYRKLLDKCPDAVSIAVPTSLHESIALRTIARGIHLLVEKPLAKTSKSGRRIINAARRANIKLMVGHVERYNPVVTVIRKLLKNESVISIDIARVGPLPPRIKDVGIIIDLAIHDIDILRFLTGSEVRKVHSFHVAAKGRHEDTAQISLMLKNGIIAHITTNWLTPFKVRTMQVATKSKFIRGDLLTQTVQSYRPIGKSENTHILDEIAVPYAEPLRLELEAFIKGITGKGKMPVTGQDGLSALLVAEKCLK